MTLTGDYWQLLIGLAALHLAALASPGPDFALIVKRSLADGRDAATMTAFGLGAGTSVHVAWAFFGLGVLLAREPSLIFAVKSVGALYLAYLGVKSLMAKPAVGQAAASQVIRKNIRTSRWQAFTSGFLTNILNPKAILYFVSIATQFVGATTPAPVRVAVGAEIVALSIAWFTAIAFLCSRPVFSLGLSKVSHWIDRAAGVWFLGFAAAMLWTS